MTRARTSLRRFRRASILAVAITSLLLLALDAEARPAADEFAQTAGEEAEVAIRGLGEGLIRHLPQVLVVFVLLLAAWLLVRILRFVFHTRLGRWPRSTAVLAVSGIGVWVVAIGLSITILAGDVRAFLGSVGLLGLAASWALQVPIESFTGWLLNAFKGYYRVGDRIEVEDVFGDVHRIDVLTTTVWEIGSPFREGMVQAEQPTGRLITFPNNRILTGSVMNLTRDFAYVWDELTVPVANETDIRYAMQVLGHAAKTLLGEAMREAAARYGIILRSAGIVEPVPAEPQLFVSLDDSWTNLTIRYLVDARQRRKWKSELLIVVNDEMAREAHREKILPVLPRQQLQLLDADGRPAKSGFAERR